MKKLFETAWLAGGLFLALTFCISALSSFIPPARFSFISLFAIAFPYLFLLLLLYGACSFFLKKKSWILVVFLLPLSYFNLANTIAFRPKKQWISLHDSSSTLRIMTWNAESFGSLAPPSSPFAATRLQMLETIQQYNPDVLCLQEYRNVENGKRSVSVRKELEDLGFKYYFGSDDKRTQIKNVVHSSGVAIYSKKPILETGKTNISEGRNENLAFADILFNHRAVRVFTAHLISFYLYPDTSNAHDSGADIYKITYNRKRSIQYKLRDIEINHQQQVGIIRQEMAKSPHPIVFCGDINTIPASYNYRTLKGDLQDAFIKKGSGLGPTFYKILPTLRIDVCLVDTAFKVIQSKVEERKLSDHYPLISDIQWNH